MKNIKPHYWLIVGIVLIILTHTRSSIGILAFLEPIPFLIYLEKRRSKSALSLMFLSLLLGWTLATAKIVTTPIPWFIAPAYALPIATFKMMAFILYRLFREHGMSGYVFPAAFSLTEWLQATLTPFATWGAMAYTQVENIVWIQITSLGGLWLLSFVIYLIAYQLFLALKTGLSAWNPKPLIVTIMCVSLFGSLRLAMADTEENVMRTVATVGTNSEIGMGLFPDHSKRLLNRSLIYERMNRAKSAGAEILVWTEAATGVLPEEEADFQVEVAHIVDSLNISAVVGYVVPTQFDPLRYQNKYIAIDSAGVIVHTYLKHQPVPGEPAVKGVDPHRSFILNGMHLGGAICYDYDFPSLALAIARLGVDIVAVPSSDWKGIDPVHTQMAAFRAVEGGYSLIRSTRWGLSAVIDPVGRFTGWSSDNDPGDKLLIAQVPENGKNTIYSVCGDWLPILSAVFLLINAMILLKKRYYKKAFKR